MIIFGIALLLAQPSLFEEKQEAMRLIQIESYSQALQKTHKFLDSLDPEAIYLHVSVLAYNFQIEDAIKLLNEKKDLLRSSAFFEKTLESICLSILKKHFSSEQESIQQATLYPLTMSSDVRAIDFFSKAFQHPSLRIKNLALSGLQNFADEKIKKLLLDAFKRGAHPFISKQIASLFAAWNDDRISDEIERKLKQDSVSLSEKIHYILVLKDLINGIDQKKLELLTRSENASMRLLSAFLLSSKEAEYNENLLLKLLQDRLIWVKQSALMAYLKKKVVSQKIDNLITEWKNSPSIELQKAYFYFSMIKQSEKSKKEAKELFEFGSVQEKKMIISILSQAGEGYETVVSDLLDRTFDPKLRAQLALYLMADTKYEKAVFVVEQALEELQNRKLFLNYDPVLPLYTIEDESNAEGNIPIGTRYKVDQSLRLKLYHLLAVKKHPKAKEFLIKLLKTDQQDLSLDAMVQFWQHFGHEDEAYLTDLLKDSDPEVRFRAALVLNYLGFEKGVRKILIKEFPRLSYNMQIQILFSLSQKKEPELIDFYLKTLETNYPFLQSIAAGCLFNLIYN